MKTVILLFSLLTSPFFVLAQPVKEKLEKAMQQLQSDEQVKSGIISLYVINSKTGKVVYDKNSSIGLAAASAQKVITSATAFELLEASYKYKTEIGSDGKIDKGTLNGNLFVVGYGDPTLGSWRYAGNNEKTVMNTWMSELKKSGVNKIEENVYLDDSKYSYQPIPGGWIWDDIGNYYGAGHWGLNWRENQYDLILKPGDKEGDDVQIVRTQPALQGIVLFNLLKTGKKGSGDNAYIYLPPYSGSGFVNGTVPAGEKQFQISGSFPNPAPQLQHEISNAAKANKISITNGFIYSQALQVTNQSVPKPTTILYTHYSPPLDSINHWFLRKSVNLYGEALVKTIAYEKNGFGSTSDGIRVIKNFWKDKGIDASALNMLDGSGLSPQNRITTNALVTVMQYAKNKPWFSSFHNSLPEYNGLKMKSGTIGGAKSFTGYSKSKTGDEYTFAIVINNYTGSAGEIVRKMYNVLDVLK
jgi:D-alanyl-D-alanine carboxypeptidase/D-alanyl-D-alanine-endopeptidase (penicillin-binding protein 4)